MRYETNRMSELWSPNFFEKLKLKKYGLINCKSRLAAHNPVSEKIRQILNDRLSGGKTA